MIQVEVHYNQKLEAIYIPSLIQPYYAKIIDSCELRAYFGLPLLSAIFMSNHEVVRSLFAFGYTSRDILRRVMGLKGLLFIHSNITFNYFSSREQRKSTDNLAFMREIINEFIENCRENYTFSECLSVEEMLVKFPGRYSFRMFIKSKPGKYGLKVL